MAPFFRGPRPSAFIFLFWALVLPAPGAALGENIVYSGPSDLRNPGDYFPVAAFGTSLPNDPSFFPLSSSSNNRVTVNGGTLTGNVYGGIGNGNAASGNLVSITGGTISGSGDGHVYGGLSAGADASDNRVQISNATVSNIVYGAKIANGAGLTADNNSVVIGPGAILANNVYGAYSEASGMVTGNSVTINGGQVKGAIIAGGYDSSVSSTGVMGVSGNSVTINSGTISNQNAKIYGGRGHGPYAVFNNSVIINGGQITGTIYGGESDHSGGSVIENNVTITGGTVTGDVYAGYNDKGGTVTGNTITLSGGTVTGTVFGVNPDSAKPDYWKTAENSLTASGGSATVGGIKNFQDAVINPGATLNVTGFDPKAATFYNLINNGSLNFYNGFANQAVAYIAGDYSGRGQIGLEVLFGQNSADTIVFEKSPDSSVIPLAFKALPGSGYDPTVKTEIAQVKTGAHPGLFTPTEHGYGIYTYVIEPPDDDGNYFLSLTDAHVAETTKVYSSTVAAAFNHLALIPDTFLRHSLDSAVSATAGRGFGISASLGYSRQEVDTVSRADLSGLSGLMTLAYNEGGTPFALGGFGEFFRGHYRIDNSISVPHGDYNVESRGDLQSFGGGMFVQYRQRLAEALESGSFAAWIPGPHLEATARLGHSRMDFETNALNSAAFSNEGAAYYGASLGGGQVFEGGPKFLTDLYGHGIWTAQRGRDVRDSLGHRIEIDEIHSLRLVSGFRSSYAPRDNLRPYLGLAADWETMSRPRVYVDGYRATPAKLTGLSGLAELGVGLKTGESVFMDFKATGSAGKRRGLGGLMEIRYEF